MKKTTFNQSKWRNTLFLGILFLLSSSLAIGQTISGKVTAGQGEALPGVSIVIKGTTKGITTDKDGNYTIDVRKNQTLLFSFIGYQLSEATIGDQTQINVTLKEAAESLEEVVVTAVAVAPAAVEVVAGGVKSRLRLRAATANMPERMPPIPRLPV